MYEIILWRQFKQSYDLAANVLKFTDQWIVGVQWVIRVDYEVFSGPRMLLDRKSTRLNSSH